MAVIKFPSRSPPPTFYFDATDRETSALCWARGRYRRLIGATPVEDYDDALELQQDRRDYPHWFNSRQFDLDDCIAFMKRRLKEADDRALRRLSEWRIAYFCGNVWGDDFYVERRRS